MIRLVVDGYPDEAPEYLTAVVELLEQHEVILDRWWRTGAGWRRLELHWQIWGSEHRVRVLRSGHEVRCVLHRSPELIGPGGPSADARHDLALALDAVAQQLGMTPIGLRWRDGARVVTQ